MSVKIYYSVNGLQMYDGSPRTISGTYEQFVNLGCNQDSFNSTYWQPAHRKIMDEIRSLYEIENRAREHSPLPGDLIILDDIYDNDCYLVITKLYILIPEPKPHTWRIEISSQVIFNEGIDIINDDNLIVLNV